MATVDEVREACEWVARRARSVRVEHHRIADYAQALELDTVPAFAGPRDASLEQRAAYVITLDAINFGSGWFPTLRKPDGLSGYRTVEAGLRARFEAEGPWSPAALAILTPEEVAAALGGQDPEHELVGLWTLALRGLGERVRRAHGGDWLDLLACAGGSAAGLVELLADWDTFADVSRYEDRAVPFYKRAQIAAADLHHAGVVEFRDLDRLTLFADNLVPHVLRLDGVLNFSAELAERIDAEEPIEHGSPEEVEIRACAVHAVELLADARAGATPQTLDHVLWTRGGAPFYKARPRHRSRTTAY